MLRAGLASHIRPDRLRNQLAKSRAALVSSSSTSPCKLCTARSFSTRQDDPTGSSSSSSGTTSDAGPSSPRQNSPPSQQSGPISTIRPLLTRFNSQLASHRARLEPKVRSELARLGSRWNTYSGYDLIEQAKQRVTQAEERLASLRQLQGEVRDRYLATVEQRATSQRTINDLLSRKASWSDQDLIQYTSLLRAEHGESRAEEMARERFEEAEREVARAWDAVVKRTLERYHDEQVWSDRVRNVSSYTQLAAVGLNIFIFLLAILLVEPYKRKRLAETFETRLIKGEEQGRLALEGVIEQFEARVQELSRGLEGLEAGQGKILLAAGVEPADAVKESSKSERNEMEQFVENTSSQELVQPDDLVSRIKDETRFLHSPKSQDEEKQRRIAGISVAIGSFVGGVVVLCLSALRSR